MRTTGDSKPAMIAKLQLALEKNELIYPSNCPLVEELLSFRRSGKKLEASPSKHDDTIMATCFALIAAEKHTNWNFENVGRFVYEPGSDRISPAEST